MAPACDHSILGQNHAGSALPVQTGDEAFHEMGPHMLNDENGWAIRRHGAKDCIKGLYPPG